MTSQSIEQLRQEYKECSLNKSDLYQNPYSQFSKWFQEAQNVENEPNAFILSTAKLDGRVSSRTVLLKYFSDSGFVFYTNYQSAKAQEIAKNPNVSMLFLWLTLERQIRIQGIAHKTDPKSSANYFKKRPRKSQIGAWASNQSQIISSREDLENQYKYYQTKFSGKEIPKPEYWGGYEIKAELIEFWQGRPGRMHDRFVYEKPISQGPKKNWELYRKSP